MFRSRCIPLAVSVAGRGTSRGVRIDRKLVHRQFREDDLTVMGQLRQTLPPPVHMEAGEVQMMFWITSPRSRHPRRRQTQRVGVAGRPGTFGVLSNPGEA